MASKQIVNGTKIDRSATLTDYDSCFPRQTNFLVGLTEVPSYLIAFFITEKNAWISSST